MQRYLDHSELDSLGLRSIGKNVLIDRAAVLINPSLISINDNSRIDAYVLITGGVEQVIIGRNVHIGAFSQIFGSGGAVILEDFSCLSGRVSLYTTTDDFVGDFMTNPTIPAEFRNVRKGSVVLRKHSLIGCGSVVLPGVEMGCCSAAGALTVLRHSVPDCVVVAGNPAQQLSRRRDMQQIMCLEEAFLRL